jgi:hypothetical protein
MAIEHTIQAIENTTKKILKGKMDLSLRKYFLLSWLQKAGRFVSNEGGTSLEWRIKIRDMDVSTNNGRLSFTNKDLYKTLNIGWGTLTSTNRLDRNTLLINKGDEAIIKLADEMVNDSSESISKNLCRSIYKDGTSDSNALTGLQTFVRPAVGANTDRVAVPGSGSTYGGLSMVLGALGGRWDDVLATKYTTLPAVATDWPDGSGDPEYDCMAFKGFNYAGAWSPGTNNWAVNCEKLLRRGATSIANLGGEGTMPSVHVMSAAMYNEFQDSVQDRERLSVSDYASKLGFPDTMQYSGTLLAHDFACPAGVAYSLDPNTISLKSLTDDVFYTDGPTWSIEEQAYLFMIGFLGNFCWTPKSIAVYGSYTA